jgi:hypothetical protein
MRITGCDWTTGRITRDGGIFARELRKIGFD